MQITKYLTAAAMLAAVFGLSSCDKKSSTTSTSGTMTMVCDESFRNVLEQEIDVYEYVYPQSHILCRYLPQSEVLDSLLEFKTATAVISRELTEAEMKHLKKEKPSARQMQIAVDAVALIVNRNNPINLLTTNEVASVLAGRDSLWNELWPADGLGKINVYFDHGGSSTVQYMQDQVLDGSKFGARVYAKGSVHEVFRAVENDKNGLGIVGVSWLTTDMARADLPDSDRKAMTADLAAQAKSDDQIEAPQFNTAIKVLNIRRDDEMDAYKPYQQYIYDGRYPFTRKIYMCTTAVGGSLGGGFYSYVTGWDGQKIISLTGIMPARIKARIVELN